MTGFQQWFEAQWARREDEVYRALFGEPAGATVATPAVYERLGKAPGHPGWLHHAVFSYAPRAGRASWLHATSGLSNPWNLDAPDKDPSGFSGLGFELVLETPAEAPAPPPFAVQLLHNLMAYELLVAVGTWPEAQLLEYGNRVPLGGPITPDVDSAIRWLLVEPPVHFAPTFELPAGRVDLFHLVGATEAEVAFARQTNQAMLTALLQKHGAHPVTDAARQSLR